MSSITLTSVVNTRTSSSTARGAQPIPRLKITRRGYALLTVLVAIPCVAGALSLVVNGGGAAASTSASSASFEHVTIQPGESLWQLAVKIAPSADPRDVIVEIERLNQLADSAVQPGQSLAIPQQYDH